MRIPGAVILVSIIACSPILAYGQARPQSAPAPQSREPVSAGSSARPAVPAAAIAPPQVAAPIATPGAAEGSQIVAGPAGVPAGAERPEAVTAAEQAGSALLPSDLTPYGMFMSADIVVKAVMLGLIFASGLTWTIWLAKTLELWDARRRLNRAQRSLAAARSLAQAARAAAAKSPHVAKLVETVETELHRSPDLCDGEGIKERITARFERIEAGIGRKMMRATGILATIGATAPFVGLFGTVWGIMNSFIGISKLHTTNLAVVAPGIAEALLATAFGLAAAIPAVVIYNIFARSIAHYRALFADTSVEILTLVSRDLIQLPVTRIDASDPRRRPAAVPMAE
jgi:biopolymer transport protein ExbB